MDMLIENKQIECFWWRKTRQKHSQAVKSSLIMRSIDKYGVCDLSHAI